MYTIFAGMEEQTATGTTGTGIKNLFNTGTIDEELRDIFLLGIVTRKALDNTFTMSSAQSIYILPILILLYVTGERLSLPDIAALLLVDDRVLIKSNLLGQMIKEGYLIRDRNNCFFLSEHGKLCVRSFYYHYTTICKADFIEPRSIKAI